jgi:glutamyl-tRNA reductase
MFTGNLIHSKNMENLILVHRTRHEALTSNGNGLLWVTCLRKLLFCLDSEPTILPGDQIFKGAEAQAFILEVICGLHSPVFGETEVQGQFRRFLAENSEHPIFKVLNPTFQKILSESKKLREKYLTETGSHTYGSLVRRVIGTSPSVALIGAGQLAQEILPWLSEVPDVTLYVRSLSNTQPLLTQHPGLKIHSLQEGLKSKEKVLIVCAQITDAILENLLKDRKSKLQILVDLRGGIPATFLSEQAERSFDLSQFMNLLNEQNDLRSYLKQKILLAIEEWKNSRAMEIQIRPFGWEDLCC